MDENKLSLWIDDIRVPPPGYVHLKSVNQAIRFIRGHETQIDMISLDHDAGDYASDGGDYIRILDWLEEQGLGYRIHLHTLNPVGRENMLRIIRRNDWRLVT